MRDRRRERSIGVVEVGGKRGEEEEGEGIRDQETGGQSVRSL